MSQQQLNRLPWILPHTPGRMKCKINGDHRFIHRHQVKFQFFPLWFMSKYQENECWWHDNDINVCGKTLGNFSLILVRQHIGIFTLTLYRFHRADMLLWEQEYQRCCIIYCFRFVWGNKFERKLKLHKTGGNSVKTFHCFKVFKRCNL